MEVRPDDEPSGDHKPKEPPEDPVTQPEPAHVRESHESPRTAPDDSDDEREREATELRTVRSQQRTKQQRISRVLSPDSSRLHWYDPVKKIWRHHIRISVPHVDCRDHLANERTFLAYLRTSVALSILGIIVAQLYRLQHVAQPNAAFGYFLLSKPIASIFQCAAMLMSIIGGVRFLRQQHKMSVGRVLAGGVEIYMIIGLVFLVSISRHDTESRDGELMVRAF